MIERFTLEELKDMETLRQGLTDDLKYEDENYRVWLSRMTVEDGAYSDNVVTVEKFEGGEIVVVDEYVAE